MLFLRKAEKYVKISQKEAVQIMLGIVNRNMKPFAAKFVHVLNS